MTSQSKKAWVTPVLEAIEMSETSSKGASGNESGKTTCGPAQGQGSQDNCS